MSPQKYSVPCEQAKGPQHRSSVITLQILCLRESRGVCHWPEFLDVDKPKICNDCHRVRNTVFLGDIYNSISSKGIQMQAANDADLKHVLASAEMYFRNPIFPAE